MPGSSPLEMLTAITTDLVTVLRAATLTDKLLLSSQLDGQPAVWQDTSERLYNC
jgi:hypothetical protein